MPRARPRPSAATLHRISASAGALGTEAVEQLDTSHAWFRLLPAEQRSWVGLVAHSGIQAFIDWLVTASSTADPLADVFGTAPRELTRSISLAQTLDLIRTVVDVVERTVVALAPEREQPLVREAVLRYSREIAFGAAQVYAEAAEARGAWDARLEALVVDAVLRGEADESMHSRAGALGWGSVTRVCVVVAEPPRSSPDPVVSLVHEAVATLGVKALATISGGRLVAILGGVDDPLVLAREMLPVLGAGPVVTGPVVPHLFAAGRSARAALSGYAAAPARPDCPRPVSANELLPERALLGDQPARNALVQRIYRPLLERSGGTLLETAISYLDATRGVEGAARSLVVHPNTVRYRLRSIEALVGLDLSDPHDAFTARTAFVLGRLSAHHSLRGRATPGGL